MSQDNPGASRKNEANLFTMGDAAGEAVKDLITQHWPAVEAIMLATHKKQSVAVSLKFTRIAEQTYKLETSIRFAEKHSDEREDIVGGDPRQQKLGIEELRRASSDDAIVQTRDGRKITTDQMVGEIDQKFKGAK